MPVLVDQSGRPLLSDDGERLSTGFGLMSFVFDDPGRLPAPLRGFHEDDPDMFDEVGVVEGGIATVGLTRPANGGPSYTPNPANTYGAIDYKNHPGTAAPGIGGGYVETGATSVIVSLTYGGHYDYDTGLHTEATAALHVTPGTDLYALGGWFFEVGPLGICAIGGVCRPPEDIEALDIGTFPLVDGQTPVLTYDTDGTGLLVFVDGVQVVFNGVGRNRFPIPAELQGSTLHGFEIDQHIVDYTAGAPDLDRLAEAVGLSDLTLTLRG